MAAIKAILVEIAIGVLSKLGKDLIDDFKKWQEINEEDKRQGELSEKNAKKYRKAKERAEKIRRAKDLLNGIDSGSGNKDPN